MRVLHGLSFRVLNYHEEHEKARQLVKRSELYWWCWIPCVSHLQLLSPTLDAGMGAGYAIMLSLLWNARHSSRNESFLPTFVLFCSRDKQHGDMNTWCCTWACNLLLRDFWVFDATHPILKF